MQANAGELIGFIDNALYKKGRDGSYRVLIEGWLLHPQHKIIDLKVGEVGHEKTGFKTVLRPDVASKVGDVAHADQSGFVGILNVKSKPEGALFIQFAVTLSNGQTVMTHLPINPAPIDDFFREPPASALRDYGAASRRAQSKPSPYGSDAVREGYRKNAELKLNAFLKTKHCLSFYSENLPTISIVMVLYNQAELTYLCLESLLQQKTTEPFELIIVDNDSSDKTDQLLEKVSGVRIIRNPQNQHFLRGANQGAQAARGEYILFLNNDTVLYPGALETALQTITADQKIGALGAKLLRPDGKLQEVGSRIFKDGTTAGIGRGQEPDLEKYNKKTEVDFVSGAFLLTPKRLFMQLGGFDTDFCPAYYEDVDYCIRLKELGYSVVAQPEITVLHLEKASGCISAGESLTKLNHSKFISKHGAQPRRSPEGRRRVVPQHQSTEDKRLLIIDDFIPKRDRGQGLPRAALILETLHALGYKIKVVTTNEDPSVTRADFPDIPEDIELEWNYPRPQLEEFLRKEGSKYSRVLVSRPHNMEALHHLLDLLGPDPVIIYDAEAIFADRSIQKKELEAGFNFTTEERKGIVEIETRYCQFADIVLTVSKHEAFKMQQNGAESVYVVSHGVDITKYSSPFTDREGFLMVGPTIEEDSPNSDGALWFMNEIFPKIDILMLDKKPHFALAGKSEVPLIKSKNSDSTEILGFVPELDPLYNKQRVFVAPIRYAAGIPLKVIEAAAHGIPVVTTPIVAQQLGWQDGVDLMVGVSEDDFAVKCKVLHSNPETWNRIRENALKRVSSEYSLDKFRFSVQQFSSELEKLHSSRHK